MGAKTRVRDTSRVRGAVTRDVLERWDVPRAQRAAWAQVRRELVKPERRERATKREAA
jgi:hypothetical protein